jgi:peptide/nickel transport system permease protein
MTCHNPALIVGGAIVTTLSVIAVIGPFVEHADPLAIDLAHAFARPSFAHWLGCDSLGRDVLARILWGARLSLTVAIAVVTFSMIVGSLIGGSAALAGGRIDSVVTRAVDIVMAFPGFLLAIALAAILGPGLADLMIALTAMGWTGYARLVRGEVLSLREREYIAAARALGGDGQRLLLRHLLPGVAGPLAVRATFGIGGIIVAEAALSFLGLGVPAPAPSWGNMLQAGQPFLLVAPYLTMAPGIAIGLAVLGFNLLGDGLAQAIGDRQ